MIRIIVSFVVFLSLTVFNSYASGNSQEDFYFLQDVNNKEILFQRNADKRIPPSSMTKVMTAYVAFDLASKGLVNLDDQCKISKEAWRKNGSSMFLNYGDIVTIDELIKGLLAVSGNDAAIAIAKNCAGSVKNFVELMNIKASELGLKNSHFMNPHGLYEKDHYMSLRDLAKLVISFYNDFPEYFHYLAIPKFTYGNITQYNRNPLMKKHYDGVIGGKTGHTNQGGYGVIAMVKHENRVLVGVINKTRTPSDRTHRIIKLFDKGFKDFKKVVLFSKDEQITKVPVWLGQKGKVVVYAKEEISINLKRKTPLEKVNAFIKYKSPVYAPIKKDSKVAELIIKVDNNTRKYPLYALRDVKKSGHLKKIGQIIFHKLMSVFN